jgi:type IV pilus assembly protein PilY1
MNRVISKFGSAALGALWAMAAAAPALADDTEVFRFTPPAGARANILLILDESRSMDGNIVTQKPYNQGTTYPSLGCDPNRVYWKEGTGAPPQCDTDQWFNKSALVCKKASDSLYLSSGSGKFWDDHMAQYNPTAGTAPTLGVWRDLAQDQKDLIVECHDDRPTSSYAGHSDGVSVGKYAANGLSPKPWSTSSGAQINWSSRAQATLYSANYVNWYYGATGDASRLEVVQGAVDSLLRELEDVNVGLMQFNAYNAIGTDGSQGGRVTVAVKPIETVRTELRDAVAAMKPETATPLAETLYEARQYFAGERPSFGTASVPDSLSGSRYNSPIDEACQENFIVFLTDGEPTWDDDQDANIKAMNDVNGNSFTTLAGAGACDAEKWEAIDPLIFPTPPDGQISWCFDDVAEFLYDGDISSAFPDTQRVHTITVGFRADLPVLKEAAERGNGRKPGDSEGVYFTANDAGGLASVFADIVGGIQQKSASFTSPTVAVNAFNRAENLSDLFVSVFQPAPDYHWPGNLKKYRLRDDGVIVDADNQAAVDPLTGRFSQTARSYWSATTDGEDVKLGGAANIIPTPRKVFTNLGGTTLTQISSATMTDALLGSGAPRATKDQVVNFINGLNPTNSQPRRQMGDPLHTQPVSVIYGPGLRDGLLFVGTNDGYLHAIDVSDDPLKAGKEAWAFIPKDFLDDQIDLLENDPYAAKHYAIDGPMRVQTVADNDGVIEPGEKVYLFFGMRRGGMFYYGLDVSVRDAPKLLWRIDATTLKGLGESWSAAVPTRVKINGVERRVLVIGGGYDPRQDNDAPSTDSQGKAVFIVDSETGAVLWDSGGLVVPNNFAASPQAAKMQYSIPGDVKVIDMNGDRIMDRMYAADMGGQVWRFDVTTNATSAATLVAGGVIAQLGFAGDPSPTLAENRRFYYSPDVAFVNTRTQNFVHIGIGSGHREHPLGVINSDRFFALRDKTVGAMDQAAFNTRTPITESMLQSVTTVNETIGTNQAGWYLNLLPGEKVLAEARTISNTIFFTTFRPAASSGSCQPQPGVNRLYRMSVFNGAPVTNLDGSTSGPLTMSDMFVENAGTISSTSQVIFVSRDRDNDGIPDDQDTDDDNDGVPDGSDQDSDNDGIPDSTDPDDDNDNILDVDEGPGDSGWVCTDRICVPLGFTNAPVRTYWRQTSLD